MKIECEKCGYKSTKNKEILGKTLCEFCSYFAPEDITQLEIYVNEKVDFREIQTYRKQGLVGGVKQKKGMQKKASSGFIVTRAPFGYIIKKNKLIPGTNSHIIQDIYEDFLESNLSLNKISKKWGFSINGFKKILTNFTYLGKIKFDGNVYSGNHKPLVSSILFNKVQDKFEKLNLKKP